MYETGVGVERDIDDAVFWYQEAARNGETTAQISLAMLYMEGEGVDKDLIQAHAWLTVASFLGNRGATPIVLDLTKKMTKEQVEQSQEIASGLLAKIYGPTSDASDNMR